MPKGQQKQQESTPLYREAIEVLALSLNHKGQAVAELPDGLKLFTDGLLPGEHGLVRVLKRRSTYAIGQCIKRLTDSPERREPPCPHYPQCGGCQLQEMTGEAQLRFKYNTLRNCLLRIAGFSPRTVDALLPPGAQAVASPSPWEYRAKSQLPIGGVDAIGFYERGSHRIVDADHCLIQDPAADALRAALRHVLRAFPAITAYDESNGSGLLRHLLVRVSRAEQTCLCTLVVNAASVKDMQRRFPASPKFCEAFEKAAADALAALSPCYRLASLWLNFNQRRDNLITGVAYQKIAGTDALIYEQLNGIRYPLAPASFFQINVEQCANLYACAMDFAALTNEEVLYDLYCGAGSISLQAARHAGRVIGIEIVEEAVQNARQAADLNRIQNAEFYSGAAETVLPDLLAQGLIPAADCVIVDPPRKGLDSRLITCIRELRVPRIVYVSCDPATLARDLRLFCLDDVYCVERVRAFDMFPQSSHVETVVLLSKRMNDFA